MSSEQYVSITPLLKKLGNGRDLSGSELAEPIADAISHLFEDRLTPAQCASLLTALHLTGLDEDPFVIAACAQAMRKDTSKIDTEKLQANFVARTAVQGNYSGGLCDIVGTGGDGHSTFNISTTASIIGSSILVVAKHGAQGSSSPTGSADVLMAIKPTPPDIEAVTAQTVPEVYKYGRYCFLFAKQFHPGMKFVAPIRKEIGFRTLFNILGPLANPMYQVLEAGVYGVYKKSLGPVYADALRLCGARKAIVVCGAEDLDEISCAGTTYCWRIRSAENRPSDNPPKKHEEVLENDATPLEDTVLEKFELHPTDFGFQPHSLQEVWPGRGASESAELLVKMLNNQLPKDHPVLEFVLMNAAALFVISGVCEADTSDMGPGDDGQIISERGPGGERWKEGVRRARLAIENGAAARSLEAYIEASRKL